MNKNKNMTNELLMTQEGYDKLQEECEYLRVEKRPIISERLRIAVGFGDLAENAEYESARLEQSELEARILHLQDRISRAKVVNKAEINKNIVSIGVKVKVKDELDKTVVYSIVGDGEGDLDNNKISILSPVGGSLIGKAKGAVVDIRVPSGEIIQYDLLDIIV